MMRLYIHRRAVAVAVVCLFIGIGAGTDGRVGAALGAQKSPLWTESPPGSVPKVQAPNFAELAEQLKPAVVNISTTQVLRGTHTTSPRGPGNGQFLLGAHGCDTPGAGSLSALHPRQ